MSGRSASSRGGRGSARGNRGRGRGRGSRGGGQGSRAPGTSAEAGFEAQATPHFTTDQLVAVVKALSTSTPPLLAQETPEEQYEEEEEEGQKGRQQSDQDKPSAKEGRVIRELVSILFDKSEEITIVKLQQEAKKISKRQEYQDPGKLATFLQKHDFFQTRLNQDGVMLVKVRGDVSLCGKYTASACKGEGCPHFHLCRNYASGQGCSHGLSCKYSHNMKDDHNIVVLQHQSRIPAPPADGTSQTTRLQELERLPRACYFYNGGPGGKSCKHGATCTSGLHVCRFYLTGTCNRKPCKLSHNIFDAQPKDLLQKCGFAGRPAHHIIGLYKESFEARRKDNQEPHRRPSTGSTHDDVTIMPEHWEPIGRMEDDFVLVDIPPNGNETNSILAPFHQTLPARDTKIHFIKRVQNPYLWDLYCKKKSQMKRQNNDELPRELRLFHGTNQEAVAPICRQNFDWRLSGNNVGQLFGRGSYFTKHASFASAYAHPSYPSGHRFMFFAKVLVGRFTKGDSSYRRPPPLNESDPYGQGYDSCVDDVQKPEIFVLFESSQCYPEYLIEYSYVVSTK
uniref:Poly [ADP-ribose] polymerase n=1 Tax=Branchiostoma floridae TaxID=7739 RepID=C3YKR0_BRAFL|eukprot:XP_002603117.1 hypothetical protein BRAFLDRAFT_63249 [Branchiostoma floridae]